MKFIPYFTGSNEKVVIAISLARIYVNNVAPIAISLARIYVDACLVHIVTNCVHGNTIAYMACLYAASMVLTGNSMGSSEIWDKYHEYCIGNGTTLVVFIPNFTATHAITSTYTGNLGLRDCVRFSQIWSHVDFMCPHA